MRRRRSTQRPFLPSTEYRLAKDLADRDVEAHVAIEAEAGAAEDWTENRVGHEPEAGVCGPGDVGPLVTSLQEQLGLRLEAQRGPVEVVVVDHIERPASD